MNALPTFPAISEVNGWMLAGFLVLLATWAFCKAMAAESRHWNRLKRQQEILLKEAERQRTMLLK
jgi:hypothetical protein